MDQDNKSAETSTKEATVESSKTVANLASKREHKSARCGMGFLLQQIRSSAASTSTGTLAGRSAEQPPAKKVREEMITTNNAAANLATDKCQPLTPSTSSKSSDCPEQAAQIGSSRKVVRANIQLPLDREFYANLAPVQVISECFRQGTTPDFGPHIRRFIGENNYVRACKWSPDGNWLLTDSEDRYVRMFTFSDNKLSLHRKLPFGGLVYDLQWSPTTDRLHFATTSRGQPIHCWTPQGELVASFRGINDQDELASAYSLSFSLSGCQIFAGYRNYLRMFDLERPGRQINQIKTYQKATTASQKGILSALATCPTFDGVFAAATFNGSVGLYSTHTNACDCLIGDGNEGQAITHLQYSSNGNMLFAGLRNSPLLQCYDLRLPTRLLANYRRSAATSQRFYFQLDPHDRYLYSGSSDGELLIYDLKNGCGESGPPEAMDLERRSGIEASHRVKCSRAAVTGLCLHPEQQLIAISTGQRLFPEILSQLFPEESPTPEGDGEEEEEDYATLGKGSPLDNSIKLYQMYI